MNKFEKIKKYLRNGEHNVEESNLRFFDNICVYCGSKLTPHNFSKIENDPRVNRTYDHVIPESIKKQLHNLFLFGNDLSIRIKIKNNLIQCCGKCNSDKGNLPLWKFLFQSKRTLAIRQKQFKKNPPLKKLCQHKARKELKRRSQKPSQIEPLDSP